MLPLVASCNIKSIRSEQNIRLVLKHIECSDSLKHMLSKSVCLSYSDRTTHAVSPYGTNLDERKHKATSTQRKIQRSRPLQSKDFSPIMLSFQKYLLLNGVKMPFSSSRFCVTQELHKFTFTLWNGLSHNAFPMMIFMRNICKTDSNVVKHVKERYMYDRNGPECLINT